MKCVRIGHYAGQAFHETLLNQAAGFLSTHLSFADSLARYIMQRPVLAHARFTSEMLIGLDDYPHCHGLLQQWHSLRTNFWTQVLATLDARAGLAKVVAQFVLMEEYYAYALPGDCTYGMLLAETCRAVSEAGFHGGSAGVAQSHVSLKLATQPLSMRETDTPDDAPITTRVAAMWRVKRGSYAIRRVWADPAWRPVREHELRSRTGGRNLTCSGLPFAVTRSIR